MEAHIRPRFVELLRLSTDESRDVVAQRFFARIDAERRREGRDGVDQTEFWHQFAIKIQDFSNFYAEVGGTPAIRGPHFPSRKVRPIFTIQRSRSGKTWKVIAQSCKGFFSQDLERAWVLVDDYEEMLSDNFYEELEEKAEKIQEAEARKQERDEKRRKKGERVVKNRGS
jgi:hypothetical protein